MAYWAQYSEGLNRRTTIICMKSLTLQAAMGIRVLARAQGNYEARLATSVEDVRAAQTLRFLVFNLELNEGLEHSFVTLRDADPFDEVCDHLLVLERSTGEVVGTYRLQTGAVAAKNLGYYSAQEFDLSPLEPLRPQVIELGRACVHIEHRNLAVLGLLWKGIASYARARNARHLIGCSSLSSQDAATGAAVYTDLSHRFMVAEPLRVKPLPELACPLDVIAENYQRPPKLLSAYLSLGAKICGVPAIDRKFKTIDFLTYMDLDSLSPATVARYLS
jgi:putative hemolysin